MRYSPSAGVFYPDEIEYPSVPDDVVSTTHEFFEQFVAAAQGSTVVVEGDKLSIAPPPEADILTVKTDAIARLRLSYVTAQARPRVSFKNAAGFEAVYGSTDEDRTNLQAIIDAGAKSWTTGLWLDENWQPVAPFTFKDLQALKAAMDAATLPPYQELLSRVSSILSAVDVAGVNAVDTSWA